MERRVRGWDERDYMLWSELMQLPSYGLIANDRENPMLSRKEVIKLLEQAAEKRFDEDDRRRKAKARVDSSYSKRIKQREDER